MINLEKDLLSTTQTTTNPIETSANAGTTETKTKGILDAESIFTNLGEKYKECEGKDIPYDILNVLESHSMDEIQESLDGLTITSLVRMARTSAVGPFAGIIGGIIDFFDGDTKDGKIGVTKQGATGDCWLLSGINALSYTDEGRKMIEEALEYGDDGYVRVHLKGVDTICVISPEQIAATKGSTQYSSGDDDMIAFELAIEKVLDDIADGKIALDSSAAPWFLENQSKLSSTTMGNSSTTGGYTNELIYLLTGKVGEYSDDKDKKEELLNKFEQNGNKDFALGASCSDDTKVKDVDGKTVKLAGPHAYAVKSVDGDTVTLTNPWNSGKDIVLSKETFLNTFNLYGCDLSDNNPVQHFSSKTCTIDKDGNWVYTFNHPDTDDGYYGVKYEVQEEIYSNGRLTKSVSKNEDGTIGRVKTYHKNGNVDYDKYYDENGVLRSCFGYDEDGNQTTEQRFYDNGRMSSQTNFDEDGNKQSKIEYAKDGHKTSEARFGEDGNINFETTFDENGKKQSEIEYGENGEKSAETKYDSKGRKQVRYEYDEQGHITREIKYDENGNEISISRYQYIN